ncbi:MAG: NrfD/PsrC family molybdoenzyme membrane anchor subunit [Chthoniobacterales bacterium]
MSTQIEEPVVARGYDNESVTRKITDVVLKRPMHRAWIGGFAVAFALLMMMNFAIAWLLIKGIGIWGVNIPVAWGFAIVNFVWWIGIGHAGTFISAILLLLHQDWRTSINRFAEAMTLFAVACAGLFPLLHLGRPWVFYWLFPYPDTMNMWPQWRSALVWDVFAVGTYFTVSLVFWYIGLVPDLATMRDRASSKFAQLTYGVMSLGWRGSARHWKRFHMLYLLLAGLATPLVLSVHSVVSTDFAIAIVPGWHSTIFPPYFVAGAIFSGFAMVLTLAIPIRRFYHLEDFITIRHLENCAKIMLTTGLMVAHGYITEGFMSWYSDDKFEWYMTLNRMFGPYAPAYCLLVFCNILVTQAVWFKRVRTTPALLFVVAIFIQIGMWTERYVIVVTSLHRDFMPSAWGIFHGTRWDWMTLIGSMGLFATLFFVFLRLLPAISISEMRDLVHQKSETAR